MKRIIMEQPKNCPYSRSKKIFHSTLKGLHQKMWLKREWSFKQVLNYVGDNNNWTQKADISRLPYSSKKIEYALANNLWEKRYKLVQEDKDRLLKNLIIKNWFDKKIITYARKNRYSIETNWFKIIQDIIQELIYKLWAHWEKFYNEIWNQWEIHDQNRLYLYNHFCALEEIERKKIAKDSGDEDKFTTDYSPASRLSVWVAIVFSSWQNQIATTINEKEIITHRNLKKVGLDLNYTSNELSNSHDLILNHYHTCLKSELSEAQNESRNMDYIVWEHWKSLPGPGIISRLLKTKVSSSEILYFARNKEHVWCPISFRWKIVRELLEPIIDDYFIKWKYL